MAAEVTDVLGPPKDRGALTRPVLTTLEALVPQGSFYRHLERSSRHWRVLVECGPHVNLPLLPPAGIQA